MKILNKDKSKLVDKVFNGVYQKYDLMNDVMSFGTHRIWKKNLVSWMQLSKNLTIIDAASGTGILQNFALKKPKIRVKFIVLSPMKKCYKLVKIG